MTPLLDRLARSLAGAQPDTGAEDRFSREALLRRGVTGALAVSALGTLIGAPKASAATCPTANLDSCINAANRGFRRELANSCDNQSSFAKKFECLRDSHDDRRDTLRYCERRCPKPKRPRKSRPTKTPPKPQQPPQLPPNPYDDGGLCAACTQAGGVCCWGGTLPGGLCVCATAGVECRAYGC